MSQEACGGPRALWSECGVDATKTLWSAIPIDVGSATRTVTIGAMGGTSVKAVLERHIGHKAPSPLDLLLSVVGSEV